MDNNNMEYIDYSSFKPYPNLDPIIDYNSYKLYPDKRRNKLTQFDNKCITECRLPGYTIRHPLNNINITEHNGPFCATNTYIHPGNNSLAYHDICRYSEGDLLAWSDMDTSNFIPLKPVTCMQLLGQFHNIHSIEDAQKWESQTNVNEITIKRVLNCTWKAFNQDEPKTVKAIKDKVVLMIQGYILDDWNKSIYDGLNLYYDKNLTSSQVMNKINTMLSDKKLIEYILNAYRKEKKIDWLTLKFYLLDIQMHIIKELKTLLK